MLSLRSATLDDLSAVVDLWNVEAGPTRHAGQLPEATALVERDPEALVVAEIDGTIVGAVIAGWDGWRFHIYRLAVVRVDAMVNAENVDAQRFWASAGFDCDTDDQRWSLPMGGR